MPRKRMHHRRHMIGKEYIDLYVVAGKFPRFHQFRCSVEFGQRPCPRSLWGRSAGSLPDHAWTLSPDMPLTLHYVLSIQFFNGKLKRKPMNSDAEEKENERRLDHLRFVCNLNFVITSLIWVARLGYYYKEFSEVSFHPSSFYCHCSYCAFTICYYNKF